MRIRLFFFTTILFVLLASACTSEYDQTLNGARGANNGEDVVFYATIEDHDDANSQTKVYADYQMRVLWNAGDQISIFNKNTNNQPYRFNGEDGDNAGSFTIVSANNELPSGNPLGHIYSVYPYAEGTTINSDGVMTLTLPAVQHYQANSFGIKANTMVSATDDTQLQFKNACGYLSFKFYGEGVSVKSISFKGNNHEKLAGKAAITMPVGGLPTVVMQNTSAEEITLTCDEPVALNANANDYIEFWLVIPPTDFTQGFTVTVTDKRGGVFVRSTASAVSVTRNNLSRMSPMEVVPEYQYVPFADANFKAYCVQNFDRNGDGEISISEAFYIKEISVRTVDIESLQGIEFMPNLNYLSCLGQSSSNRGKLTTLDISNNTALEYLNCSHNQLTSIDVSQNTSLTDLLCYYNQLTSLDVSKNTALTNLSFSDNQLTSLDVSHNTALTYLSCYYNQLTSLDVSNNTALTSLSCNYNQLTSLNISQSIALTYLNCAGNQLKSLDVSQNTALTNLDCAENQLTSLNVSNNSALSELDCRNNASILVISIRSGQIIRTFNHDNNASIVETGVPIPQGNITFTDPNFKAYCVNQFDINNDGEISYSEALLITGVYCTNQNITSLSGIEFFTNLRFLSCDNNQLTSLFLDNCTKLQSLVCDNNNLKEIDLSHNSALTDISIFFNDILSIDVTNCPDLVRLRCDRNRLETIDISHNPKLKSFDCSVNKIKTLNVKCNPGLVWLSCDENELTELDISMNPAISGLYCSYNQLHELSVNQLTDLTELICDNNQIASLEISNCPFLVVLGCNDNLLSSLDVSNNSELIALWCHNNPYLLSILLKTGQTIPNFNYDTNLATIIYK